MAKKINRPIIHILVGLPGSGKTYFAKQMEVQTKQNTKIVNCDEIIYGYRNLLDEIRYHIQCCSNYTIKKSVVIDGLFLTNKDIICLLKKISTFKNNYDFVLHMWNEDRETCIKNDAGRRKLDNKMTIKNIQFEKVNLSLIQSETNISNITIQEHIVILKPDWKLFIDNSNLSNSIKDDKLYSSEWCLGGGCEEFGFLSAEPQPLDFEEFDELIEQICPDISYLKYKKIYRNCVTIETRETSEYYVGRVSYGYYVCDMEKLYLMLVSFGYDVSLKKGEN